MINFERKGQKYIGVEVPPEVENYIISDGFLKAWPYSQPQGIFYQLLPDGNYEILGLVKDIRRADEPSAIEHYIGCCFVFKEVRHNLTNNTLIIKIIT